MLGETIFYAKVISVLGIGATFLNVYLDGVKKNGKLATGVFGKSKDLKDVMGSSGIQISKNIRLSEKASFEGITIIGPTGSGKTTSKIVPNLLNNKLPDGSFIVTDPKMELYKLTANYLKSEGYKVILFCPTMPQHSVKYNPLRECESSAEVLQLAEILLLNGDLSFKLQNGAGSGSNEWLQMATPLLAASLLYVKSKGESMGNISQALKLLLNRPMDEIDLMFSNSTGEVKEQYSIFKTASGSRKTASSILITLSSNLRLFLDENINKTTSSTDFNAEHLRKEKTAVFISIPERKSAYYSPFTASLFSQIINKSMDYYTNDSYSLYFLFDEFCNVGLINSFPQIVSTTRSRRISFTICLQNIAQLNAIYGHSNAQTILNNLKTKVCLPGLSDLQTLNYVSDLCGETEITVTNTSKSGDKTSASTSTQRKRLINSDELRRLNNKELLIIAHNKKVVKDKQNIYYEQECYLKNCYEEDLPECF